MRFNLTGKIIQIGSECGDYQPSITVLLRQETEEEEEVTLTCDLSEADAVKVAPHLYDDVRVTFEILSKPKLVGENEA